MSELLTYRELATKANIWELMVRKMAANGELPVVHFGRAVRVPRAYLSSLIADALGGAIVQSAVPVPATPSSATDHASRAATATT
jgi:excisionase family DNA binding protein